METYEECLLELENMVGTIPPAKKIKYKCTVTCQHIKQGFADNDTFLEYHRNWCKQHKEQIKIASHKYYLTHKDKIKASTQCWKRKNIKSQREYHRLYQQKNRLTKDNRIKDKARALVQIAVKTGKLIKLPCLICGELTVQGHHDDYSRPLEVTWLCVKHHEELHHKKV